MKIIFALIAVAILISGCDAATQSTWKNIKTQGDFPTYLNMDSHKIYGLMYPFNATDPALKGSTDAMNTSIAAKLPLTGGTMAGPIAMGGYNITGAGNVSATAFYGNGVALTGITGATGGVANTGSTTIGADTDANGVGVVSLQTRNTDRMVVENNGSVTLYGVVNANGKALYGLPYPVNATDPAVKGMTDSINASITGINASKGNQTTAQSVTVDVIGSTTVAYNKTGYIVSSGTFNDVMNFSIGNYDNVCLADGPFTSLYEINNFTLTYVTNLQRPISVKGNGHTRIIYNGNDCVFNLSSEAASDAKTVNYVKMSGITLDLSGSTSGTGIKLKGACFNKFEDVLIQGSGTTTGMSLSKNSYGSWCLLNVLSGCIIRDHDIGLNMPETGLQVIADEATNILDSTTPIFSDGDNILWLTDTQLTTKTATGCAINATDTWGKYSGLYIDQGLINLTNGHHSFGASQITMPNTFGNVRLYIAPDVWVAGGYKWNNTNLYYNADYFPLKIEAEDTRNEDYGTIISDTLASNGSARRNTDNTASAYLMLASMYAGYHNPLPRGRYVGIIRAKDTDQVASDCEVDVWDITSNTYPRIKKFTLTSGYVEYPFEFNITASNAGHALKIGVCKFTDTANTISLDYVRIARLGSEYEDETIDRDVIRSADGSLFRIVAANNGTLSSVRI